MSLRLTEQIPPLIGPAAYLAKVVSVQDPDSLNRVQVRLYNCDGNADEDAPVWARVATPFAGANKGAFLFPDTGDEVLVVFLSGDPRFPVVIGSFWNGADSAPDQFGSSVDKWTFTGKNGTKIAILEEQSGQETIKLTTPGGQTATITDQGGGSIELDHSGGSSIKIDTQGITITSTAKVSVTAASQVSVSAPTVNVDAAMSQFSGIVQCSVLQATTVIGTTYTPGAGNIW
ncbi:MAG TPA: phage baseplate assembly protein V [Vicinamibacterales bacterium]|nr:phage baseplate assembly protein V [Vicinamibacterales bacterium]